MILVNPSYSTQASEIAFVFVVISEVLEDISILSYIGVLIPNSHNAWVKLYLATISASLSQTSYAKYLRCRTAE
jgi:hypothetical protein